MKLDVSQRRMLIAIGLTLIGVYAFVCVLGVFTEMSRLRDAESDFNEMNRKISEIQQLSEAPRVAALDLESPDAIVNRINASLRQAGLPVGTLDNQAPSEPQRIGQSDFTLRSVRVVLQHAPLNKIIAFCDALKDEETGSVVRDLNLTQPKMVGNTEQWKAQMTLTQMIFSPKSET